MLKPINVVIFLLTLAFLAWTFRYDLKPAASNLPAAFLLDRWTGTIYYSPPGGVNWHEIKYENAKK